VEASRVNPNPPPGPAAKATRINGQMVNLHALALTYRICALAVISSLLLLAIVGVLLSRRMELTALGILIGGQLATGIAISIAFRQRRLGDAAVAIEPAPLPSRVFSTAADVLTAALCSLPLLGLLPAADLCGRAHRIFNTLDVPVGMLGPSAAALAALRLGVCHHCGYDINHQPGDTCPECGSDIAGDKSSAPSGLAPVRVDSSAAASCATACTMFAALGLFIGIVQLSLLISLASDARPHLFLIWLPGMVWGAVASVLTARALRILAARGTVDHAVVLLTSLIWPVISAFILGKFAFRLRRAAESGTNE
jgi:hypothetical protein